MKLIALVLFTAAAAAFAQSKPLRDADLTIVPGANTQAGCPIAFTDVSLKASARIMPVHAEMEPASSLAFQYRNQSGKDIRSITVRAELQIKRSVYDLDSITIARDLTLTEDGAETLPLHLITYGLGTVTLEQVAFADGTIWSATTDNGCSYRNPNTSEKIAEAQ